MTRETLADRLARNSVRKGSCMVWASTINSNGYGTINVKSKTKRVHRVAYELARGPIPDGLSLDHLCRNRACINPDHMEPVTRQVNSLRGVGPSAVNAKKTHCINGHELTGDNVRTYLGQYGKPNRRCQACAREYRRRYYAAKESPKALLERTK